MTSYLLTCSLYQKMSRFKVFQYEISDRMSYSRTLYDNFKNFRKKIQWKRVFEKPLASCKFSSDFKSESGFDLAKEWKIEMRGPLYVVHQKISLPPSLFLGYTDLAWYWLFWADILCPPTWLCTRAYVK